MRQLSWSDALFAQVNSALSTLFTTAQAVRDNPASHLADVELSEAERRHAAGLMRVNHVGEICAQALYQGQALVSQHPPHREMLLQAANEEMDHLAWTEQRLAELNSRTSVFNPLWYAGSFVLGVAAGKVSEAVSLGFVIETERQVGAHLDSHLNGSDDTSALPAQDVRSRAIVAQMRTEELEHAAHAQEAGGVELPNAVRLAMKTMAKVMTTTAYRL